MNKKTQRLNRLVELLRTRGYLSIKELSALLEVSEMTVRRDLTRLKEEHVTEHATQPLPQNEREYNLMQEIQKQDSQKDKIGRYAASMVEQGDIIILDTGTTTGKIVPYLPSDKNITVLCYNINILMELYRNPGVKMIFSGGHYHPNTQMFECAEGIQFMSGIRAQKVFISAAGVHTELGVTCVDSYEVPTKRTILKSALQKILVVDSGKFDRICPAYFCDLTEISEVITDSGISPEWREKLAQRNITLHIV